MATPRRGEVWLIDFGMAGKTRPALVVRGARHENEAVIYFESLRLCVSVRDC